MPVRHDKARPRIGFRTGIGRRAGAGKPAPALGNRGIRPRAGRSSGAQQPVERPCRPVPGAGRRQIPSRGAKRFTAPRLRPLQSPPVSEARQRAGGGKPHDDVCFRCSDRHGRYLGHHSATVPTRPDNGRNQSARRVGFRAMKKFVFTALAFTAIIWGTTAAALRHSQQDQLAIEETGVESSWSITETGAAPGWSIRPAHLRMW